MKVRNLVFLCTHGNAKESPSADDKSSLGKEPKGKKMFVVRLFALSVVSNTSSQYTVVH